jgi:hypothetical protein
VLDLTLACHRTRSGAPSAAWGLLTCTMTGLHGGDAVRFAIAVANVAFEFLARHPRLLPPRMPSRMSARGRSAPTDDQCESYSADDESCASHENLHHAVRTKVLRRTARLPPRPGTPAAADFRLRVALVTALRQRGNVDHRLIGFT